MGVRRMWAAGAAGMVALVAGCAQGTGGGDATEPAFTPEATMSGSLQVMGFGAGDEIATTRLDRAKAELDGVDVSLVEGDLDIQAFLSAVAAGDPPDIVYANRDQIGTFASRGAVVPLDECYASEDIDQDAFVDAALDQVTFGGHLYGVPEFNTVQLVMADAGLLKDAGLTLDDVNGSDWAAITSATTALARSDGGKVSVIGYDSKLPEFLPLWAQANGADLLSDDGRTAQLDSPEVLEALEFAVGVYDEQGGFAAVKATRDAADFFGAGNQFATSTLGAMPMEQWYVNVLNEVSPDAPMAFDAFRTPAGDPLAYATGSAWAIPAGSGNPAAACRFAAVMTQQDSWLASARARAEAREADGLAFTGILTGNEKADQQIRDELVDVTDEPWASGVEAMYEANDHTFTLPANPADSEFKAAWQDAVNRVLNGQQDAAAAMAQAQEEAQAALDKAWARWDDSSASEQ
ncbi:extracellular solute-binding protein [Cellulomonas sp. DKR-3]|uniref:Extracellular solute-binding protein n=1 Tax=Cellulomonas fulva TaxID=2835530 RepID=A0ABS5TZH1_9CELL|nr:extracellular solute-binding protein [Cellulomonas fulva]MBT0994506.1 extracellular solute-binding protein [Cellulomonas fulva]